MKFRKDKWKKVSMGSSLFQIIDGDRGRNYPKTSDFFTTEYCLFLNAKNVTKNGFVFNECQFITHEKDNQLRKGKILKNDFVITTRGTIGNIALYSGEVTYENIRINSGMIIFRILSEEVNHYYLYSALRSIFEERNIKKYVTGTAQLQLPIKTINKIEISLPPLEEQKQIATLFQSLENAIEQVENQEKNLKALQKKLSSSLISTNPIFGNLLTDTNCNLCTFEDITNCVEKHDKKPLENGITRFIGLEFIEAENFNLQGFGEIEKGTTFTKCFLKNDVLFGKRRAYLKKVAVADFDGICSGDILVFRAKKEKMLPELLPYYVSSDAFIQHAVNTSAGSLSPPTKWKDLKEFKISIPDLKTQKKIAEIFQQLQLTLNQLKNQKITLNNLKQKLLSEILG